MESCNVKTIMHHWEGHALYHMLCWFVSCRWAILHLDCINWTQYDFFFNSRDNCSVWDIKGSESFIWKGSIWHRLDRRGDVLESEGHTVVSNRNFLTHYPPVKRAEDTGPGHHLKCINLDFLYFCFAAGPELWSAQEEGQMSGWRFLNHLSMTWLFYTLLLPLLLTFMLPKCLWQSIALIGTLLPPAQNSTSYSNTFSIMHQGLSWQA